MAPIVTVDHITKKYSRNANTHLSYGATDLMREIFGRRRQLKLRKDEFFAVNDVSFTMAPGDSLALIGRNGSGKTTLLKMMNCLIKPDAGMIVMEGRVQALINLGAGFNPALSGKDNIYNSSSLMGMSRKETQEIVDEVVDFAELEEFIDSPVGTYSSGMKARLGFAVAIHLRPDILLIDEILSVGDHAFQNKCFMKMQELKRQGVTIVLVSHSHTNVIQICERALWLHKGVMRELGPAQETVQSYLSFLEGLEGERIREANQLREELRQKQAGASRPGAEKAQIAAASQAAEKAALDKAAAEAAGVRAAAERAGAERSAAEAERAAAARDKEAAAEAAARAAADKAAAERALAQAAADKAAAERAMAEAAVQKAAAERSLAERERAEQELAEREALELTRNLAPGAGGKLKKRHLYHAIYDDYDFVQDIQVRLLVDGQETETVTMHEAVDLEFSFYLKKFVTDLNVSLVFYRKDGLQLSTISTLNGNLLRDVHIGRVACLVRIPDFNYVPGAYVLVMPIHEGKSYLFRDAVKEFLVRGNGRLTWSITDFDYRCEVLQAGDAAAVEAAGKQGA